MNNKRQKTTQVATSPGPVYGLGFVGALVYCLQQADTFWGWVLGFLEALVWPALLIYKLFELVRF